MKLAWLDAPARLGGATFRAGEPAPDHGRLQRRAGRPRRATTRRSGAARTSRANRSARGSVASRTGASPTSGERLPATSRGRSRSGTTGRGRSTGGGDCGSTWRWAPRPSPSDWPTVVVDREERKPTHRRGQTERPRAGDAHAATMTTARSTSPGSTASGRGRSRATCAGSAVGGAPRRSARSSRRGTSPASPSSTSTATSRRDPFDGPGGIRCPRPEAFAATLGAAGIGDDRRGRRLRRRSWLARGTALVDARRDRSSLLAPGRRVGELDGIHSKTGPPSAPARPQSRARPWPPDRLADAQTVLADLRRPRRRSWTSARPERYRGEVEPLDPVAGHIPGARERALDGDTRRGAGGSCAAANSARTFAAIGVEGDRPAIAHCGSGVTACHELFALRLAGLATAACTRGPGRIGCETRRAPSPPGRRPGRLARPCGRARRSRRTPPP